MKAPYTLAVGPSTKGLRVALVWARSVSPLVKTEAAPAYIAELLSRVRASGELFLSPERKGAVRDMLRFGSYKPAGRAKPSSEYLLAAAIADEFPLVNGPVDANNAVSLEWGYPASVFDAAKTGSELFLRRGSSGETYIFNPSGQEIDLTDLLVVCRRAAGAWEPCGNPVKDAMATKVFDDARDIVAVVYAPAAEAVERLESCSARFCELLENECGAAESGYSIVEGA